MRESELKHILLNKKGDYYLQLLIMVPKILWIKRNIALWFPSIPSTFSCLWCLTHSKRDLSLNLNEKAKSWEIPNQSGRWQVNQIPRTIMTITMVLFSRERKDWKSVTSHWMNHKKGQKEKVGWGQTSE